MKIMCSIDALMVFTTQELYFAYEGQFQLAVEKLYCSFKKKR